MSIQTLQENILKLPIEERIEFAKLILDSIEVKNSSTVISSETKSILDNRLAAIEQRKGKFSSWEEVKAKAKTMIQ